MYRILFRLVLVRIDPERAHRIAYRVIRLLNTPGLGALVRRWSRPDRGLSVTRMGIRFDSPFGVAAGFDKEGLAVGGLHRLGFGHVEVGTITALPQAGNPRPRLFRLPADRAVINRMGFNNHGAVAAHRVLAKLRRRRVRPVVGVNIGKSRVVGLDDAVSDYLASARELVSVADYLVVNVSSPNTPGLRGLQELDRLRPLLQRLAEVTRGTPLLVKIAPDLEDAAAVRVAELAVELGLAGLIATNTTLSRAGLRTDPAVVAAAGDGGLSGAPLAERSLALLKTLRAAVPAGFCLISVGGVETAADVQERLTAGADLVQGYTAFLYEGPGWARRINRDLFRLGTVRA